MVGWMDAWMVGWMDGWMDGWMMVGWLVGWVGWLVDWLVGSKGNKRQLRPAPHGKQPKIGIWGIHEAKAKVGPTPCLKHAFSRYC